MNKTLKYILCASIVIASCSVNAQESGGYNESVVVRGSYRPVIEQSEKINFPAVITDSLDKMQHNFRSAEARHQGSGNERSDYPQQ